MDPSDFENPTWNDAKRVHNWHTWISEELRAMWGTFTREQKEAIAKNAQNQADLEEWD